MMRIMPLDPNYSITMGHKDHEMELILNGHLSDTQILDMQNAVTESGYSDDDYEVYPMTKYVGLEVHDENKKCDVIMLQFLNTHISREQAFFIQDVMKDKHDITVGIGGKLQGVN